MVTIPKGASLNEIADSLAEKDVILSRVLFIAACGLSGKGSRLQNGVYRFPHSISLVNVIGILAEGSHQIAVWITVNEGSTIRTIASILHAKVGIDSIHTVQLAVDRAFLQKLGIHAHSLEGYLFPDTYFVRLDDPGERILSRMVHRFRSILTPADSARAREMKYSLYQILTMASIVEGETRRPEERARVAGVYYNRLRLGMLLQADPTIQYIIPDGPRRLLYRDLRIESPYNTYRHKGFPPGPVNNPGRAAIDAALYPEKHGFLYFVANGTGGHVFSTTAREHARAVAAYRAYLRSKQDS